jgi:hypothetical protein
MSSRMALAYAPGMIWPIDNELIDPALAPLIEAGQGESEGFELAEQALVRHATHSDDFSSGKVLLDADNRSEDVSNAVYGEADEELHADA